VVAISLTRRGGRVKGMKMHISGQEQLDLMKDTRIGQMLDEDEWQARYDNLLNMTVKDRVLQGAQAGIATLFSLLVMCMIYLLVSRIAGGLGSFAQVLGVTFWSGVVGTGLASVVKLPLILLKGSSLDVVLGPAVFFSSRGVTDFWFQLFSLLDLFTIWSVVLVAIGFEKIHDFERPKALTVSISASLVVGLIMFGLGRLFV
jgi:Yip1-like protein